MDSAVVLTALVKKLQGSETALRSRAFSQEYAHIVDAMREFEDDPEVDKDNAAPVRTVANSAVEGTDCQHEYHQ